jgi:succinate dehydrogenase hydrophobic anchor subunit
MKKYLTLFLSVSLLVLPFFVLAQEEAPVIGSSVDELVDILNRIGNLIFTILLVIAFIFLVVAGMNFITSSGDPVKTDKARTMLMYCLVGVGVALLARGAVALVKNLLGA